ncbi:MAG TPA: FtsX-like permease family protein [Candidatus Polarisedimenticolia bacterium]|nr:FtsX-like permease family protein [Candidatus Polarisedimenticolia bacterium]
MIRLVLRGLAERLRAGPVLFLLTLAGVALGVASALSIQILNRSALQAFEASAQAVSGESDLTVAARGPRLAEEIFPKVLGTRGVAAAWPVLRTSVALPQSDGAFLEIVGLDLYAARSVPWKETPKDLAAALSEPGWIALTPKLAAARGWKVGDAFEATSGSRRLQLKVGALVDFQRIAPLAGPGLAVMDIAQAQALLGRAGEIDQVEIRSAAGAAGRELAQRLRRSLGPGVRIETPEQRRSQALGLLSAFRLNLTALSLVSLFVGTFLVYASIQASLLRRRAEFGLLRSLGAGRGQVAGLILAEVGVLSLAGVAIGLPLGVAAARANVKSVSATLSNLYLLQSVEHLSVPPGLLVLSAVLGLAAALAGSVAPCWEMSRKDARSLLSGYRLHERVGAAAPALLIAGVILAGSALIWYATFGSHLKPAGFVVGVAVLLALPLMSPYLLELSSSWMRSNAFALAYGVRSLGRSLGITAVAAAALTVTVSMLVGITVMIGSFRRTLELWVDATIRADVYVSTESYSRARGEAGIDAATLAALQGRAEVRAIDRLRQTFTEIEGRRVSVIGVDMELREGASRFALLEGDAREALRRARDEGAILVGEPLARKAGLRRGDRPRIVAAEGERRLPIAGVYYDYGSEQGSAAVDLKTFAKLFGEGPINNMALYLKPGADAESVAGRLQAELAGRGLRIRSNRELRQRILAIFDDTFAVTRLLRAMGLLIAVCGVTLTLLVLAREQVAELALYRALGASRPQIFRVFLGKGMGLAGFSLAAGSAGGMALALILIYGINRAYFGWTIALHFPAASVAADAALLLACAIAASLYPALRAARTPAVELSREDR